MDAVPLRPVDVSDLVQARWAPLAHVERGWSHLNPGEREEVARRIRSALAAHKWGKHPKDALLRLFAFLAQVETIAIEIPLRFLPTAPAEVQPLLRRQLVDEVFHSALFSRLAHELAAPATQPPAPLQSAERLLDRIRREPDIAVTATLLNLVAEGWIETLFRHALRWGVANQVFRAVLADESRHVDEAPRYMRGLDLRKAEKAVRAFEQGMLEVSREPAVALALLELAGPQGQQRLSKALFQQHRRHLRAVGLQPSPGWEQVARLADEALPRLPPVQMPKPVEDTHWRRLARQVWTVPRDPTMQGDFDLPVGHIPRKALTATLIAGMGRALAAQPELNRVVARGRVWQLPYANVGVRVLLDDDELATVVVPEADRRSVRDIGRLLQDGIEQLRRNRASGAVPPEADPEVAALVPALPTMFAMAVSNAGKWGVVSGAGSFSGWVSPSTDITVGLRRRLPRWRGVMYLPSWHVNVAAIQDHRVFDGRASALCVRALQQALSPAGVKEILAAKDTLPSPEEVEQAREAAQRNADPHLQAAAPMLAFLGLPKYTPIVVGGMGLGLALGIGAYALYAHLNPQQQQQQVIVDLRHLQPGAGTVPVPPPARPASPASPARAPRTAGPAPPKRAPAGPAKGPPGAGRAGRGGDRKGGGAGNGAGKGRRGAR